MAIRTLFSLIIGMSLFLSAAHADDASRYCADFFNNLDFQDRELGRPKSIKMGKQVDVLEFFQGQQPVHLFLELGRGRQASAFAAHWNHQTVTAKKFLNSDHSWLYIHRELRLSELVTHYFTQRGWPSPMPKIFGYDPDTRLMLKEFKPGITLKQLRSDRSIPKEVRWKAMASLKVLAQRLRELSQNCPEYQAWERRNRPRWHDELGFDTPVALDLEWQNHFLISGKNPPINNLIYFDGDWWLIDP